MDTHQVRDQYTIAALQQQVMELSDKLQQAELSGQEKQREHAQLMAKAQQASWAKIAFFANMSHEIRTPMNAITGFSQLMMTTDLTEKQRYYLQQVTHGGDTLLRLIDALFDLSKLESGTFQLEHCVFVLDELVKRLYQCLLPKAEQKGLLLGFQMSSAVPDGLMGDGSRIYKILFHLVENAIKFTEQGTVDLQIGFRPLDEVVQDNKGDQDADMVVQGNLEVVVKDSGIGMDKALRMRLFQPFTLGDDSLTRQQGGSGLGLAICSHLLALMGGTIAVTSGLGKGSEFRLKIPLSVMDNGGDETGVPANLLAGRRILLVDDHAINRQITNDILSDWKMIVLEAEDGAHAIRLLQQEPCDLVLMDVLMPVMGGLEASRCIRAQAEFASLPIVAMTGNSSKHDRLECLEAGMNDVLVKPIDFDALPQRLLHWFNHDGQSAAQAIRVDTVADKRKEASQHHLPSLLPAIEDADRDRALRALGGNVTLYYQLLDHFPLEHAQTPSQLREALVLKDLPTGQRLAHTLKSSAASLGARVLMGSAAQVEQALGAGKVPTPAQLQMVTQGCDQLTQVLLAQVGAEEAAVGVVAVDQQLSRADFAQQVGQLWDTLGRGEERSISMLEEMLPRLRDMDSAGAERIRQLVDGFDFVAAAALLKHVTKTILSEEG